MIIISLVEVTIIIIDACPPNTLLTTYTMLIYLPSLTTCRFIQGHVMTITSNTQFI